MLPNIGYGELLVILVVALLLFGANRIPEVARSLGRSVNAFKSGLKDGLEEGKSDAKPDDTKKP
jgi:sec-independent protein translocase protein TatA